MRTSWKTRGARASAPPVRRRRVRAGACSRSRRSTSACCAAGCGSRCTCMPATATCTRTSRSTPTTTRCCRRRIAPSRASWRSRATSNGVISGEHGIGITKLEFLSDAETADFRGYKERIDPEGHFNRGKLLPGGDLRNAYTPSFNLLGPRVADHAAVRHQLDLGRDQGLPALRQVQARVRDARAAREPALFAAQQDSRDLAADRGVPVRGADASRRLDPPLRRVLRRGRPLHRVPQVRDARARSTSISATCRWRCATCCGAWARSASTPAPRRRCSSSTRPIRRRSSWRARSMIEWGFKAQRLGESCARRVRVRTDGAAAGHDRQGRR